MLFIISLLLFYKSEWFWKVYTVNKRYYDAGKQGLFIQIKVRHTQNVISSLSDIKSYDVLLSIEIKDYHSEAVR